MPRVESHKSQAARLTRYRAPLRTCGIWFSRSIAYTFRCPTPSSWAISGTVMVFTMAFSALRSCWPLSEIRRGQTRGPSVAPGLRPPPTTRGLPHLDIQPGVAAHMHSPLEHRRESPRRELRCALQPARSPCSVEQFAEPASRSEEHT